MALRTRCMLPALLLAWPSAALAAEPIRIDVVLPATGSGAFLGAQEKMAVDLVGKLVNRTGGIKGRPVEFVHHDDQTNPQIAVQLFEDAASAKPVVILGEAVMAECAAIAPLTHDGPVDYCFTPVMHAPPGSYVFSAGVDSRDGQLAGIRFLHAKGINRLAMMTSTDASGQDAERGLDSAVQEVGGGVAIVASAHFNLSDISVSAQMEHLKAANPQALLAWTTGTALATILKAMIQEGLDVPVMTSYGNMTYAQMDQYAEFLPKTFYFPASVWSKHPPGVTLDPKVEAAQKNFYALYKENGLEPDSAATLGWDSTLIVIDALRAIGPQATAQQLRDFIAQLTNYGGVSGIYDFTRTPQRGLTIDDVVVTRWSKQHHAWEWQTRPGGALLK